MWASRIAPNRDTTCHPAATLLSATTEATEVSVIVLVVAFVHNTTPVSSASSASASPLPLRCLHAGAFSALGLALIGLLYTVNPWLMPRIYIFNATTDECALLRFRHSTRCFVGTYGCQTLALIAYSQSENAQ